jgi:glycosyltransferase involved in cell wall biosynthesis
LFDDNLEVIFVHDIQDQSTAAELHAMVARYKFANYQFFEDQYGGPGAARNAGLRISRGQWIIFWDSDDYVFTKEYFEVIKDIGPEVNLIIGNYEVYDVRRGSSVVHLLSESKPLVSLAMNPGIWRMIFRRSAIEDIEFPNLRMAEDQVFICRFLSRSPKIFYTEKVFYRYFIGNESQLTRNTAALKDLSEASKLTLDVLRNPKSSNSTFTAILYERQIITGIKNGAFRTKVSQLVNQVLAFISLRPSQALLIARALTYILSDSTRGSHR